MADSAEDRRIGTVIAGYRIDARIGRGGMGVVYRAHHLQLERQAALKLIAPDLAESSGFRERFAREARIAAALAHPNIVTVYDAGEVDGTLYLAMQYVEGSDLAEILSSDGRLKPYRAIDVGRQVASALDAAHASGLIHRDVKPANVLISGRDAFLTDFGLGKRIEGGDSAAITVAGDVVGTIHYVAPEQIEGTKVTPRTDVYSLGCLLYHCLSGRLPFERENDVAVIYAHLSEPPPRLPADLPDGPQRRHRQGAGEAARAPLRLLRGLHVRRPDRARRRRAAERDGREPERGARGDRRHPRRAALARAARGRGRQHAGDRARGAGRARGPAARPRASRAPAAPTPTS